MQTRHRKNLKCQSKVFVTAGDTGGTVIDHRPRAASENTFSAGLGIRDPWQFSSSESACNRAA